MPSFSPHARRALAILTASALALLVAACVFAPGRFTSRLDVLADRTFTFRYTGQLIMVPLKEEADKAAKPFEPEPCEDEESGEDRACTAAEIAEQKEQASQTLSQSAQMSRALLGGIDPSDPQAGRDLADKLRRRQGWNKVDYLGNGIFDVDYVATGKLDHEFVFPVFEEFPMTNAFVQITPRKDGSVRINAPAFGPENANPATRGMGPAAGLASDESTGPTQYADGTFAIHTNGKILANNTDEGPAQMGNDQVLSWAVNPHIPAAPTALIQLDTK